MKNEPIAIVEAGQTRAISCTVDDEHDGLPVYRVLREQLRASDAAVRRAKQVEDGIRVQGRAVWANTVVRTGQNVALVVDAPELEGSSTDIAPEKPYLDELVVRYADRDIVVLDKPAGVVMYPSAGHDGATLANYLAWWLREQGRPCGIHAAHRLDKGTSGLVVFALHSFAKDRLQTQLGDGIFFREYLAVCEGAPNPARGTIDAPLGMLSRRPNVFGVKPDGKPALTHYELVAEGGQAAQLIAAAFEGEAPRGPVPASRESQGQRATSPAGEDEGPGVYPKGLGRSDAEPVALLRVRLETGRTHQIRIHLAHRGHPLVGDATYGNASPLIDRPALHSWRLELRQPLQEMRLSFESPLPADMRSLILP